MKKLFLLAVSAAMALSLASCGKSGGGNSGLLALLLGNSGVSVVSTTPANNATGVALNSAIMVNFSEDVLDTSVNASTFGISPAIAGTFAVTGSSATFTPGSNLAANTLYTVTLATGIESAVTAGKLLKANHTFSFTTGATADTTGPTVASTEPADMAVDVAVNRSIAITFSEAIAPASVTGHYTISGSVTAAASVVGAILTLDPDADLDPNTTYTVDLDGITDLAGNPMAAAYSFSFSTVTTDAEAPVVLMSIPSASSPGQSQGATITVVFSEAIDTSTVNSTNFSISPAVDGSFSFEYGSNWVVFNPTSLLPLSTTYTVTIKAGGIEDLAGNAIEEDYTFSFTTTDTADKTSPTVYSVSPVDDATSVSQNKMILAQFNESIKSSSVTSSTFTITDNAGGAAVSGTIVGMMQMVYFMPSTTTSFKLGHTYTATLTTGITDLVGNPLTSNYSWSFTIETTTDTTAPTVVSSSPANGTVDLDPASTNYVSIIFDDDIAVGSISSSSVLMQADGVDVICWCMAMGTNQIMIQAGDTGLFVGGFHYDTTYTITLKGTGSSVITDDMGNKLNNGASDTVITFTTQEE